MKRKVIFIEGIGGAGKSTYIDELRQKHRDDDKVCFLRFPSDASRALKRDADLPSNYEKFPRIYSLSMINEQLLAIMQRLDEGYEIVYCDRGFVSTLVYQHALPAIQDHENGFLLNIVRNKRGHFFDAFISVMAEMKDKMNLDMSVIYFDVDENNEKTIQKISGVRPSASDWKATQDKIFAFKIVLHIVKTWQIPLEIIFKKDIWCNE
jgi:hypothetical protein